jgi:hypothetical protein
MAGASPFAGQLLLDELTPLRARPEDQTPDEAGGADWDDATSSREDEPAATPTPTVATGRRRGDSIILFVVADFALHSSAFDHGGPIPRRHSCEGADLVAALLVGGAGGRALARAGGR